MYHHDGRDYKVATSEAANHYRPKFEQWMQDGAMDATHFLGRLERETPQDKIVNTGKLGFNIQKGRIFIYDGKDEWLLHKHAVSQMVAKTGILTGMVADRMMEATNENDNWGRELLLHNLRTIFQKTDRERVLLRAVPTDQGPEVRGFLSDKYRRMSCGPIIQQFAQTAMSEFGAVPIRTNDSFRPSYFHDTKVGFSLWLKDIFEPVPNEILLLGIMVQNSDFGAAALTVRMLMIRIWCTNLAITQDELRKVHLGARLSEDIHFSQQTYELDTQTMASAVTDITRNLFAPVRVNAYMDRIRAAAEQKIEDPKKLFEAMRVGGHLLKNEASEIAKLFNEPEIEMMPAGQNVWRASNAISLFANMMEEKGSAERAVELRHTAGLVIDKYVENKAA